MVSEADAFHRMDSNRLKGAEKSFRFRDARKCHDCAVLESFRRNRCFPVIYAFNLGSDGEARNWQLWQRCSRNILYACRVCSGDRSLRFAPAAGRKQDFTPCPLKGIYRHNVDITVESSMLESIIQKEHITEFIPLGEQAGLVSICSDDDRDVSQPLSDENRLVPPLFPIGFLKTNDENTPTQPAVTT